jgi:UDP-3-O-[3-hydroxymyristoyl] N-acetylglucosamine deacetylase
VRHKIIDALGDLWTAGGMIVGTLESVKGSHGLNNLVLKKLFSNPDNYDIV